MHEHDSVPAPAPVGHRSSSGRGLSRRDLLRRAAWLTAGVPALLLLEACGQQAPAAPTSKPAESKPAETKPAAPAATTAPAAPAAAAKPTEAPAAAKSAEAAKPTQAAPAAASKTGGQATMAIFGTPGASLLGNFTSTNYGVTLAQCQYEAMFGYDEKLQLQPKLAEKYDLASDGKTWTFTLKQGLKWSDGQPVTAKDVEATVMAMTHPATVTNWISFVEEIVGALERKGGKREDIPGLKVVDDRTIQATTINPSAIFLDLFGTEFTVLPKHMLESVPPDQLLKSQVSTMPTVSTGPFHLTAYQADQVAEFSRNPNYWGKQPALEKVFVKIMTPETAIVQLEKGELEVIPGEISGELPPVEADRLKKNPDITVTSYPNNNTETLYMNHKTAFGDVRTRQALYYAIDREAIVKQLLLGYGKVAYSVYPEFLPYYKPDLNKYAYDPAKAKQLLSEAGWDSSKPLNYVVPTGDTIRTQLGTIIQQFLQAVGFNAQIEETDFATSTARSRAHTFDLMSTQNRGYNNLDVNRRFNSNMTEAGVNAGSYSNPELDQAMAEARTKTTTAEQKPLTDKIQQIINQDAVTVMMYYRDSIGAVNTKKLDGAVPKYLGVHRTMQNWALK